MIYILAIAFGVLAYCYLRAKQDIEELIEKQNDLEDHVLQLSRSVMEFVNFLVGENEDENDN